jgi:hypothetical protein
LALPKQGVAKKSTWEQFEPNYEISPSAISALLNPKPHFVRHLPISSSLFNSKPASELHRIAFPPAFSYVISFHTADLPFSLTFSRIGDRGWKAFFDVHFTWLPTRVVFRRGRRQFFRSA